MKKLIPVLALLAPVAYAHDADVSWTNATEYTNSTPINQGHPANAIDRTEIRFGTCNGDNTVALSEGLVEVAFPLQTIRIPAITDGRKCFQARHITIAGNPSLWSTGVAHTFAPPPPPPPPAPNLTPRRPTGVQATKVIIP